MSSSCLSLSGTTQCPAWNGSSISTDSSLYGKFPFLKDVSSVSEFDNALRDYVMGSYVKEKYVNIFGCNGVNLTDTDNYYARYTTSVICNGLVQSSKGPCDLSDKASRPLCASTCGLMAQGEQKIVANSELCSDPANNVMEQIRADLAVCSLPDDSVNGNYCIKGFMNEPKNCGYGPNTLGLCGFCGSNSANSTDPCCSNSNAASQCADITVPTPTTTLPPLLPTSSSSSTSTAGAGAGAADQGLSGGEIAGVVIGSVAGASLIAILIALILLLRRRRRALGGNGLNQPNPQRKGSPSMQYAQDQPGYNAGPVGRVTRMSALREVVSSSPGRSRSSPGTFGDAKYSDNSDSDGIYASPGAMSKRIPPVTGKRHGSLSSSSVFAGFDSDTSPHSGTAGQYSSPEGMTSGQSEQLSSFRDYYSQDDIHPADKVSVLWAYQPRAGDEFELDRGDMLKVIGIWDDGWATGVRIPEAAEEFDERHREQRDSGVSNGSQRIPSPAPIGDIKAFPLVCVCLPQHWRKIIDGASQSEGDLTDEGTG